MSLVLSAEDLSEIELLEAAYELPAVNSKQLILGSELEHALKQAAESHLLIPTAQEQIRQTIIEKEKQGKIITDIERDAREYQIEYIAKHLTRASETAQRRIDYLSKILTFSDVEAELTKCQQDIHHWFAYYAWGYDPRPRSPLNFVPFLPFPVQAALIDWLNLIIFQQKTSGMVEKSRDEGATDITTRHSVYHWRFTHGFAAFFSSRNEDAIDSKKNLNTLFERCRFQIRLMPRWMLPEGFDLKRGLLADKFIFNPENQASILGQAPTQSMGRSDRVTVAYLDEFAFYPFAGYPQYKSLSQTTDSIIPLSSVAGKLNKFADLAFDGVTAKFIMDWKEHPFKDRRWYDSLPFGYISPAMSRAEIAQEVDRDYDASQPGKVWNYNENYLFITQTEFLEGFSRLGFNRQRFTTPDGRFYIPEDWNWSRFSDYGQTKGHEWAYSLASVPAEIWPLNDTVFVFVSCEMMPTGLSTREAVALWREYERSFGLRNAGYKFTHPPQQSQISHEQLDLRKTLLAEHGESWVPWNTDYNDGIEGIQNRMDIIDLHEPNPFRPQIMGRSRIIFVAQDDEYTFAFNERMGAWFVTMSSTDKPVNFATLRRQLSIYHYPESERGKPVKAMRPEKEDDDVVDTIRALGICYALRPKRMTEKQRVESMLSPGQQEVLKKKNLSMGEQLAIEDAMKEATRKVRKATDPSLNSMGEERSPADYDLDSLGFKI